MLFPNGTLLQVTGKPAQYVVLDTHTCEVLASTERNLFTPAALSKVKQVSQKEFDSLPPGTPLTSDAVLVKGSEDPVYLLSWSLRCWIVSHQVFGDYGFDYSKILVIPDPVLSQFQRGPNIE